MENPAFDQTIERSTDGGLQDGRAWAVRKGSGAAATKAATIMIWNSFFG